jgi:O-antigen ligase
MGTAAIVAASPQENLSRAPLAGVLGYANARAGLLVMAAAAAVVVSVVVRPLIVRAAAMGLSAVLALLPLVIRSAGGAVLGALVLAVGVLVHLRVSGRSVVLTIVALFLATLGTTLAIGARGDGGTRPQLWHEALVLTARHPLTGVGPGRFDQESPTARNDRDLRWAHNGFLQIGAETGVPGIVLLVLLVLVVFARLAVSGSAAAAAAAGALGALAIHACIDYVLHFAALPVLVSALAGTAIGYGSRRSRDTPGAPS